MPLTEPELAEHEPQTSRLLLEQERYEVEMRRSLIASFKALPTGGYNYLVHHAYSCSYRLVYNLLAGSFNSLPDLGYYLIACPPLF